MSKLFTTLKSTVEGELVHQLSPLAKILYPDIKGDNLLLYRVAAFHPDFTHRDLAIIRQLNDFSKKFIGESTKTEGYMRDLTAWNKFNTANQLAREQNENFATIDSDIMETLERARVEVDKAFWAVMEMDDSPFLWAGDKLVPVGGFSTGPGTCTGVEGTSVLQKYRGTFSVSSEIGKTYLNVLRKISKPIHDLPNYAVELLDTIKAIFVPKDQNTSRMIAPQLNGDIFLQYPACALLEKMLINFDIDLGKQQFINREMARSGSLFDNEDSVENTLRSRSPRFCTIDLVSASDVIGRELVKFLMPPPLYSYMEMCSPSLITWNGCDSKKNKEPVQLQMMATMGNAFCFPLQTVVFASIVKSLYGRLGLLLKKECGSLYSVYGDDIIVDITSYKYVIDTLKKLEMLPNCKKSFSTGLFRESCGADFFNGYDVRPVSFESITDDTDKYSLLNRLLDWGARHSVSFERTSLVLMASIKRKYVVPMDFSVHKGLRIPEACLSLLPTQWKKGIFASVLLDKSFIFNYFSPKHFARTNNIYNIINIRCLEKDAQCNVLKLKRNETSLFPFLRGGIKQVGGLKFLVASNVPKTFEHSVTISFWDGMAEDLPESRYFGYDLKFFAGYLAVSGFMRSLAAL